MSLQDNVVGKTMINSPVRYWTHYTETKMLSFWQLPVQPVKNLSTWQEHFLFHYTVAFSIYNTVQL